VTKTCSKKKVLINIKKYAFVVFDGLNPNYSRTHNRIHTMKIIAWGKYATICTWVLFRTIFEIELIHCIVPEMLTRKRYYVLFVIPVFIIQVTKLIQFT
jgi:hypothetical protein